jgi:hypothetical protein
VHAGEKIMILSYVDDGLDDMFLRLVVLVQAADDFQRTLHHVFALLLATQPAKQHGNILRGIPCKGGKRISITIRSTRLAGL